MLLRISFVSSLLFVACGPTCPEPQYEGRASDEAWRTMIDGEQRATADAMKAAALQLTDGTQLPASPIPTFRWTTTLASAPAPVPMPAPRRERPWWKGLLISEAHAHLPPVTGVIHWFKFVVPGEKCPVEVLSTRTEYTPTEEIWTKLRSGNGARSVTAQSAYLTENRITEGPFKTPSPLTFTVAP